MFGNLFVKAKAGEDLRAFAEEVFRMLQLGTPTLRESVSYIGGEYAVGHALGITVSVAIADDAAIPD